MIIKSDLSALKQADLMALFGVTDRTIQLWHAKGLPRNGEGRGCTYVWKECLPWYVAYVSGSKGGAEAGSDRARREKAEADMAEMEARKMAGELLERKPAILAWINFLGRLKDNLLGYSGRVAPRLEDGMVLAEREAVLNREMHQVLRDVVAETEKSASEVEA